MRSSTSSSSQRVPADGRRWHVVVALLLAVGVIAGLEVGWRAWGLRPSIVDGTGSWVAARERIEPRSTVLLGASRIQAAIDPDVLREETGTPVVQLALPAGSPLPLLQDLAREAGFEGQVVVDFMSSIFFNVEHEMYQNVPRLNLEALHDRRRFWKHPSTSIEAALSAGVAGRLAVMNPEIAPRTLIERLAAGGGRLFVIKYKHVRRNRFAPRDFQAIDARAHMVRQRNGFRGRGRAATVAERDSLIEELERAVQTLRGNGASVVLVRFPVCGLILELEETEYPREQYWEVVAKRVTAPTIDFEAYPELSQYSCHDGSHLDWRETAEFTRALASVVSRVETDWAQASAD